MLAIDERLLAARDGGGDGLANAVEIVLERASAARRAPDNPRPWRRRSTESQSASSRAATPGSLAAERPCRARHAEGGEMRASTAGASRRIPCRADWRRDSRPRYNRRRARRAERRSGACRRARNRRRSSARRRAASCRRASAVPASSRLRLASRASSSSWCCRAIRRAARACCADRRHSRARRRNRAPRRRRRR